MCVVAWLSGAWSSTVLSSRGLAGGGTNLERFKDTEKVKAVLPAVRAQGPWVSVPSIPERPSRGSSAGRQRRGGRLRRGLRDAGRDPQTVRGAPEGNQDPEPFPNPDHQVRFMGKYRNVPPISHSREEKELDFLNLPGH